MKDYLQTVTGPVAREDIREQQRTREAVSDHYA